MSKKALLSQEQQSEAIQLLQLAGIEIEKLRVQIEKQSIRINAIDDMLFLVHADKPRRYDTMGQEGLDPVSQIKLFMRNYMKEKKDEQI